MTKKIAAQKLKRKLSKAFSSNWFFFAVISLFIVQMLWIATFSIYPMIFDEEYHLGIIDIYSRQISPFINNQPAEAAFHGDITRYGSYLFHYLMSLPYSVITHFTHDLHAIVLAMRIICITFVIGGVLVFRKFLLSAGFPKSITHLSIAFFTLIPIVPFALSQINYDSLAFLLIATIFYLSIKTIRAKQNQLIFLILLISVSCLSCLVKFTILPIAFVNILFAAFYIWRQQKEKTPKHLKEQLQKTKKLTLIFTSVFLVFSLGLFTERYGVNLIKYHAIEPKCDRIHSEDQCIQYAVWRRDITWKQNNNSIGKTRDNPAIYTATYWAPHIVGDFNVVAAYADKNNQANQIRYLPDTPTMQGSAGNIVLIIASWVFIITTLLIILVQWRKLPLPIFRYLVIFTLLTYATSLWLKNYGDYLNIGSGTAAQGRYFIPFLIPVLAISALAWVKFLRKPVLQVGFFVISAILISQGGGVTGYILYSNANWYWPEQRKSLNEINQTAKNYLRLLIPF